MKILIVGNGSTTKINGEYYKDKHTSRFLKEVASYSSVEYCSWLEPSMEASNKSESNLHGSKLDYKITSINERASKQGGMVKLFNYVRKLVLFVKEIKKIDFVYLFYRGNLPFLCALLCILMRKKFALYIRCDYQSQSFLEKLIVKKARFVLCNGELFRKRVLPFNRRCELVAPMIDFSKKDSFAKSNFHTGDPVKLLFVARLEKEKGVFVLLQSIQMLKNNNKPILLNIVGDGVAYQSLVEFVKESQIGDMVKFHGLIKDKHSLLSLYRESDIFVFPSCYPEGFPRVLYEAMLASLAIITTTVGSISTLMSDRGNCLYVEKNDSLGLTKCIEQLIMNDTLRKEISINANNTILDYLDKFDEPHSLQLIRWAANGAG